MKLNPVFDKDFQDFCENTVCARVMAWLARMSHHLIRYVS